MGDRLIKVGGTKQSGPHCPRRGIQVFFQQDGGEPQSVAVVVETKRGLVGREIGGRTDFDTQQVADRVAVFGSVQPTRGDPTGLWLNRAILSREFGVQPMRHAADGSGRGPRAWQGRQSTQAPLPETKQRGGRGSSRGSSRGAGGGRGVA